jgi:hypothetical protein
MIRWTQLLLLVLLVVIMMALSESESQNPSIHDHPVGAGYHLCESEATQEMFDYFAGKDADTGEPRTAVVQGTKVAAIRTLYPGSGLRGEKLEHMRHLEGRRGKRKASEHDGIGLVLESEFSSLRQRGIGL